MIIKKIFLSYYYYDGKTGPAIRFRGANYPKNGSFEVFLE
jgi:hypothetical protein